jgi:hypothetical protein
MFKALVELVSRRDQEIVWTIWEQSRPGTSAAVIVPTMKLGTAFYLVGLNIYILNTK